MTSFIALVANGTIDNYAITAKRLTNAEQIIAVDGGLIHCDQMQITPDLLIGDLDSCPQELIKKYPDLAIERYPEDKNETDLELALQQVAHQDLPIHIFGALHLRTDHTLYNLQLLRRYPGKVVIESSNEMIMAISGHATIETVPDQTISLIPVGGPVEGVTTQGLKWELKDAHFDQSFMSISNQALGSSFSISINSGDLLCIIV